MILLLHNTVMEAVWLYSWLHAMNAAIAAVKKLPVQSSQMILPPADETDSVLEMTDQVDQYVIVCCFHNPSPVTTSGWLRFFAAGTLL